MDMSKAKHKKQARSAQRNKVCESKPGWLIGVKIIKGVLGPFFVTHHLF